MFFFKPLRILFFPLAVSYSDPFFKINFVVFIFFLIRSNTLIIIETSQLQMGVKENSSVSYLEIERQIGAWLKEMNGYPFRFIQMFVLLITYFTRSLVLTLLQTTWFTFQEII